MKTSAVVVLVALAFVLVPAVSGGGEPAEDTVVISPKEGGWSIEDLFRLVSKETGESIIYDPENPRIANRKIEFVGEQTVPRKDLFSWFQSLLSFQRLILAPVMGGDWVVLDMRAPQVRNRPIFVCEKDLGEWRDRRGVYIVSTVALDRPRDAEVAHELLAPLVSAECGQLNHVASSGTLVLADFAPRVFALARLARRLSQESSERRSRHEELLAASRTETAARWFVDRLATE